MLNKTHVITVIVDSSETHRTGKLSCNVPAIPASILTFYTNSISPAFKTWRKGKGLGQKYGNDPAMTRYGNLWLAGTLLKCYFRDMSIITAKQLHQETKAVLNQLEQGESLLITRNGRTIGRIEPLAAAEPPGWPAIMDEVWSAQKSVKSKDRVANPVLQERQRRRR
jgi:antitoxin (DNA-binding transcriptional repressor) of toxin-antitoxin stability system